MLLPKLDTYEWNDLVWRDVLDLWRLVQAIRLPLGYDQFDQNTLGDCLSRTR